MLAARLRQTSLETVDCGCMQKWLVKTLMQVLETLPWMSWKPHLAMLIFDVKHSNKEKKILARA